jgi:hypothetical protein
VEARVTASVQNIADVMLGTIADTATAKDLAAFSSACQQVATLMGVRWTAAPGASAATIAMATKAAIMLQITAVANVCTVAASKGYVLPDNPFTPIAQLNIGRRYGTLVKVTALESTNWPVAAQQLSQAAQQYAAGTLTFNQSAPGAQLSSFEVSVDGISSQSGDALGDVLGYQPNATAIAVKQGLDDQQSQVSFSSLKPYFLFLADVITGGKRQNGTIVCWQVMPGATAYTVSKRDVFNMVDLPDTTLDVVSLAQSTAELQADTNFMQLMSFYDWVGPTDYVAYVDDSNSANTVYAYSLTGLQTQNPAGSDIFNVQTSALYLSSAQVAQVQALIQGELTTYLTGSDTDAVSPYPALSQVVYGDPGNAWILAGCNVIASTARGDAPAVTAGYAFLGSKASNILALAAAGKLVAPSDVSAVTAAVDASISSFGVSQTVLGVLNGTGVSSFISGQGSTSAALITLTSLQGATGGLAKIVSAIDVQTSTMDPQVLTSALAVPTGSPAKIVYAARPLASAPASSTPSVQGAIGTDTIDLTTYQGIEQMMEDIRTLYDFYPSTLT